MAKSSTRRDDLNILESATSQRPVEVVRWLPGFGRWSNSAKWGSSRAHRGLRQRRFRSSKLRIIGRASDRLSTDQNAEDRIRTCPAGDRPSVNEWDRSGAQNPRGIAPIQDSCALCRYCREGFEHRLREAKSSRPMPEANCCRR